MYIALLEDDQDQRDTISMVLETARHDVQAFEAGAALIEAAKRERFDLFILDWMLPDIRGDKVLRWLRENLGWDVPVLMLTSNGDETSLVSALRGGADDYVVKPAKSMELLARIEVLGRRGTNTGVSAMHLGAYEVDSERRTLRLHGDTVDLTQKEFDLAAYLFRHPGKLLSRMKLLEAVWGIHADVDTRTVDTHVSRIRRKLQLKASNGWQLTPVYGCGYRLERAEAR